MQIQDHENKNAFIPMGQLEDTTLPHKSIFMHHSKIKNSMPRQLTSEVFYLQLWFTQVDILSRIQDHENKNADCFMEISVFWGHRMIDDDDRIKILHLPSFLKDFN